MSKGKHLENAVKIIETVLFQNSIGRENILSIEPNKLIKFKGVPHEIDLYIRILNKNKKEKSIIFECKNREVKADKNDIIVFSEKRKRTNSKAAFFIAKHFTKGAINQAKLDRTIKLITFDTRSGDLSFTPVKLFNNKQTIKRIIFNTGLVGKQYLSEDLVTYGDETYQLNQIIPWLQIQHESQLATNSAELLLQEHTFESTVDIDLESTFIIAGDIAKGIRMTIEYQVWEAKPVINTQFNINSRGSYYHVSFPAEDLNYNLSFEYTILANGISAFHSMKA